jgi:hypothetical protein
VAYLVPKNDGNDDEGKGKMKVGDEDDEGAAAEEVDGKTAEYEWVREYSFRKDQQHSATYFFVWDDESVRYNEIQAKIVLDKIKSQVGHTHDHTRTHTTLWCSSSRALMCTGGQGRHPQAGSPIAFVRDNAQPNRR